MDLLFKRYASPFLFLDILIENNNLSNGIDELIERKNEDRWWEMYLATLPLNEMSYEDWKKASLNNSSKKEKSLSKKEVETTVNKSQQILSNFKPLKKERG